MCIHTFMTTPKEGKRRELGEEEEEKGKEKEYQIAFPLLEFT